MSNSELSRSLLLGSVICIIGTALAFPDPVGLILFSSLAGLSFGLSVSTAMLAVGE